jgi:hypothetical protein
MLRVYMYPQYSAPSFFWVLFMTARTRSMYGHVLPKFEEPFNWEEDVKGPQRSGPSNEDIARAELPLTSVWLEQPFTNKAIMHISATDTTVTGHHLHQAPLFTRKLERAQMIDSCQL